MKEGYRPDERKVVWWRGGMRRRFGRGWNESNIGEAPSMDRHEG
jgi:hypothetical protein